MDLVPSLRGPWLRAAPAALVLSMLPLGAPAQSVPAPDRFEVSLGVQAFAKFNSNVRVDSLVRGIGTRIRLETDVNLDERVNVARGDVFYNFNPRHYIAFATYDIERTGTRHISRRIRFGERTFEFGTNVTAIFDEEVVKLAYGYNALVRPRAALGPSFGLHVMRFEVGLGLSALRQGYRAETTAPLPVAGVRGYYRIGNRWGLRGALELFDIKAGNVRGVFRDVVLTFEHRTFDHVGFGFGFNFNTLDVSSGDDDLRGVIDLSFQSGMVYIKGRFGARTRSEEQGVDSVDRSRFRLSAARGSKLSESSQDPGILGYGRHLNGNGSIWPDSTPNARSTHQTPNAQ